MAMTPLGGNGENSDIMSEINITPEENAEFTSIAREAAAGRLRLFFHAAFGTLAENIRAAQMAEGDDEGIGHETMAKEPVQRPTDRATNDDQKQHLVRAIGQGVNAFRQE